MLEAIWLLAIESLSSFDWFGSSFGINEYKEN